ncbi:MAG: CvpA family protein [Isosphaeraceae bacterium]
MGLDLALGGLVLLVALRGWIRGFVIQAIRLAGLVGAVYAAVPLREFAKPYAAQYFPSIRADQSNRLMWWVAVIVCYFVFVGVGKLAITVGRRNSFGVEEKNRSDQFAGFGLGIIKGLIVASFALGAMQKYGETYLARIDWAQSQMKESQVWAWGQKYQPAEKIWTSVPVREFVGHVQRYGLNPPASKTEPSQVAEDEAEKPVQTASRTPKLVLPGIDGPPLEVDTTGLPPDLVREVEALQKELQQVEATLK